MSICTCEHCDTLIDSDDDPGCFVENPYDSRDVTTLCEICRERSWERQQELLMEDGGPSLIEQQLAAYKLKIGIR